MKLSNYFLSAIFLLSTIVISATPDSLAFDGKDEVNTLIDNFLTTVELDLDKETVTMFSDLLINEDGDLYNVDFMVLETGEVVVLSKEYEEEFYKVDTYSTMHMVKYSFPVAQVSVD